MANMTNREFYNAVIEFPNMSEDMIAHARKLIASMDKRNEARASKPSKAQIANAPLMKIVLSKVAESANPITASEIFHMEIEGLTSVQKVSGLLGNLFKENKVDKMEVKVKGKGKQVAYFIPTEVNEG